MSKEAKLFEYALTLVSKEGSDIEAIKTRGLGLSMALLSLATLQTQRFGKLGGTVKYLEDKIFNKEEIDKLKGKALLDRYTLAHRVLEETSSYVGKVVNTIDWNDIQAQIVALTGVEGKTDVKTQEMAKRLLEKFSKGVVEEDFYPEDLPDDVTKSFDEPVREKVKRRKVNHPKLKRIVKLKRRS